MRRPLRSLFAVATCAAFFVQTTGAADFAPALARGAVLPPPAMLGAAMARPGASLVPHAALRAPRPAGQSWLASAKIVSDWSLSALEDAAVALDAWLSGAPEAGSDGAALLSGLVAGDLPHDPGAVGDPSRDRMLIAMQGQRILASGITAQLASLLEYRTELRPYSARFTGEWTGSGAARARVDYLSPFGVTKGEKSGYRIKLADGYERLLHMKTAVPETLMKEVPLYFSGDTVEIQTTVRNEGPAALTGLRLVATQEDFVAAGGAGAPIASPVELSLPDLAPGGQTSVRWKIKLSSTGEAAVNFEQTHLRVLGKDPAGGEKVILDEAQAGVVDPPRGL